MDSLSELRRKMIRQNFSKEILLEKEFKKFFIRQKYDIIAKFWEHPSVRVL